MHENLKVVQPFLLAEFRPHTLFYSPLDMSSSYGPTRKFLYYSLGSS